MDSPNPAPAPAGYPYDVFVTYADGDHEWVRGEMFPRLMQHGLLAASDQTFMPGVPVIENIELAIIQSRYVVAVLSPAYLTDRWARYTWTAALSAGAIEDRPRFLPVVAQAVPLPAAIERLTCIDLTDPTLAADRWDRLVAHLTAFGREKDSPRIRAAMTFRRIADLLRDRDHGLAVRDTVVKYRAEFEPEVERTRRLRQLKRVHDILHDVLIGAYRQSQVVAEGYPKRHSVTALEECARSLGNLNEALDAATRALSRDAAPAPAIWLRNLVEAHGALQDAFGFATDPAAARADPRFQAWARGQPDATAFLAATRPDYIGLGRRRLAAALGALARVLNRQPGMVNAQLFELAGTIRLRELADTMRDLLRELERAGMAPGLVAELRGGVEGLDGLSRQKDRLLKLHDNLQQADILLGNTEAQVARDELDDGNPDREQNRDLAQDRDLGILAATWAEAAQVIAPCAALAPEEFKTIQEEGKSLAAGLARRDHFRAVQAFGACRGQLTQVFYNVDKQLLWLCDALGGVGRQLSRMLDS